MIKKRPVVGFYGITGCAGCLLSFIFNEEELLDAVSLIDLKAFPFIKKSNVKKKFDIIFLEGTVTTKGEVDIVSDLRARTKFLIALGACSCTGGVPAFRNFISDKTYKHLVYHKAIEISDLEPKPIDAYVKVDYYLPGCPPDKKEILNFIKGMISGKVPIPYDKPVCVECRFNKNRCLLDDGKLCLGPITRGNCNSVCTNGKLECWGCRGPTTDANVDRMIKLLEEKGFHIEHIRKRLKTFVGLKVPQLLEPKKWLE